MSTELAAYLGLFASAFAAATLLPAQSEAVLVLLLLKGDLPVSALVAIASLGNVLGSIVNWCLGRWIERFRGRPWFPVSERKLERARDWYRRYGKWSLLGSWFPVVGDPITVLAGILREPLPMFILLVSVAKVSRYVVTAGTLARI
ncbi:YqaA family protein [Mycoplana ramosa]|uniref:YqaA family protein n=1 Tax=Mycoplana ramosa TaxID=40837 RepID=UPI00366D036A